MAINTTAGAAPVSRIVIPGQAVQGGDRSGRFGAVPKMRRRLIVVASGLQKHGKDHWAFTAPGPVALLALDEGWEDTAKKFEMRGKVIKPVVYEVPEAKGKKGDSTLEQEASAIWTDFVADYKWALDNFRSVVVDTATEMWELLRLARFGALSTGQTTSYGPVNTEMRKLIREAYNHDANVIFLQKLGKKYINREWNGDYEPKGFTDMAYEAQVVVRLYREDPNIFHAYVEDCRQDPALNGLDFDSNTGLNTFGSLASMIYPGSAPGEWE